MARPEAPAPLAWVICLAILAVSGAVQGRLGGRWSPSVDLTAAVARLDRLPYEVGTWKGEDADVDRATLQQAGIAGGVVRRYRDARTGSVATVMLVCGRPGPVSVHTPDVCYEKSGYEIVARPSVPIPGFEAATLVRADQAFTDRLQVYWSWNASGRWEVPSNPRVTYGARPFLYKLYVIRALSTAGEDLASGPAVDLAKALAASFEVPPDRR